MPARAHAHKIRLSQTYFEREEIMKVTISTRMHHESELMNKKRVCVCVNTYKQLIDAIKRRRSEVIIYASVK